LGGSRIAQAAEAKVAYNHTKVVRGLENLFSTHQGALATIASQIAPIVAVDRSSDAEHLCLARGPIGRLSNMNPQTLARALATLDAVAIVLAALRQGATTADVLDITVEPSLAEVIRNSKMASAWAWMEVRKIFTSKF
jgi:hypothetical protein